jgi:molecular chaperone GrpE
LYTKNIMDDEKKIEEQENTENKEENFEDVEFIESTEDGDELPKKDVVKKLREDLKKALKDKEEYLIGWQRAKADYINLEKDATARFARGKELGREELADSILPALDAFDMAMKNKEAWEAVDKNWRMGIEYIYSKLIQALGDNGIAIINDENVKFDPVLHESVENVPTEDKEKDHTIAASHPIRLQNRRTCPPPSSRENI